MISLLGSLNPVTLGHVQCFEEARKTLLGEGGQRRPGRLEAFDCCIGLLELNSDQRVGKKMAEAGDVLILQTDRSDLVQLATADKPWLGCGWPQYLDALKASWPKLNLTHFEVNGADDVVKYGKFWSQPSARMIVMGRPGSTEAVRSGMADARDQLGRPCPIDDDDANFIMGPELPDISGSAARRATAAGDEDALSALVHPAVAAWLLQQPWAGGTAAAAEGEANSEEGSGGSILVPTASVVATWGGIGQRLVLPGGYDVTDDDLAECAAEVETLAKRLLVTAKAVEKPPEGVPPPPGPSPPPPPPPPAVDGPPPPPPGLDARTTMMLEIEKKPLEKALATGSLCTEEEAEALKRLGASTSNPFLFTHFRFFFCLFLRNPDVHESY